LATERALTFAPKICISSFVVRRTICEQEAQKDAGKSEETGNESKRRNGNAQNVHTLHKVPAPLRGFFSQAATCRRSFEQRRSNGTSIASLNS